MVTQTKRFVKTEGTSMVTPYNDQSKNIQTNCPTRTIRLQLQSINQVFEKLNCSSIILLLIPTTTCFRNGLRCKDNLDYHTWRWICLMVKRIHLPLGHMSTVRDWSLPYSTFCTFAFLYQNSFLLSTCSHCGSNFIQQLDFNKKQSTFCGCLPLH